MTAVARLMITYFAGTTLLRVVTALGLSAVGGGAAALLFLPPLLGGIGMPSSLSLGAETFHTLLPVFGTLAIALGASLMPALFARLAASHYAYVLPYGRAKLQARQALALREGLATYEGGREIDFVLGTANPWSLALGQIAPILLGTYFLGGFVTAIAPSASTPWFSFLTILSAISGAIASFAATRSRAHWLRAHWTRAELFVRVEGAFWRYNCYTLGVLLLMLVALGDYYALPTRTLAFGLGLLALGTTLSTYLGLMVTATLGWGQAVLAAATMLSLIKAAAYVTASATPQLELVALGAALSAAALLFRRLAERRWLRLDWMLCRAEPSARAAT